MALPQPVNRQTRVKHYVPVTLFAGGKNDDITNILQKTLHENLVNQLLIHLDFPKSGW